MAYIYPTADATIIYGGDAPQLGENWVDARTAGTGTEFHVVSFGQIWASYKSGRGTTLPAISRAFFEFDTSGISVAPSSGRLQLWGITRTAADAIAVRSTLTAAASGGMSDADFDAIYDSSTELAASDGSGAGTLAGVSGLAYSAEQATWNTGSYNSLFFNATALADMASLDTFKVCVMEYDHDYLDVISIGDDVSSGFFTDARAGTSEDPRLEYIEEVSGADAIFFGANF